MLHDIPEIIKKILTRRSSHLPLKHREMHGLGGIHIPLGKPYLCNQIDFIKNGLPENQMIW